MPLYALDETKVIFAKEAKDQKIYRCLSCSAPVKKRGGRKKVPHFYHVRGAPVCRLHSKKEDHLRVQLLLQRLLATKNIALEVSFPELCRIADVVWEEKKLIFEIQCSEISETEVKQRIEDYSRLGYVVVWLLDDRKFNKKMTRKAEIFLRQYPCYFFSFSEQAPFLVYDQLELFDKGRRVRKSSRAYVQLNFPHPMKLLTKEIPNPLKKRNTISPIYFSGDWIDRIHLAHPSLLLFLQSWELKSASLSYQKKFRFNFSFYKKFLDSLIKILEN